MPIVTVALMGEIDYRSILPFKVLFIVGTMLNFGDDLDGNGDGDITSLSVNSPLDSQFKGTKILGNE